MQGPDDEQCGAARLETAFAAVASGDCDLDAAIERFDLDAEESALLRDLIEVDGSGPSVTPVGALLEAVSEFEPPEIPGYSIYEPLGAGGMGVVHRAIQISTGQTVAIKVIGRQGTSAEWRARFQREIAILGRLRHPGIVQILDAGSTAAGDPYFVMQFVEEGMRIDQWCERQGLDADTRIALFKEVLAAVGYLHHAGVLHRDLKPSNILVDKQGRPRIIDFGISVPESGGEFAATVVAGTPAYMSPESSASRLGVAADTRADIYSLGTILAGLLGVRLQGSPVERCRAVLEATPEPRVSRARTLLSIVARSIEPDPNDRIQSAERFAEDLDALQEWRPVSSCSCGPVERLLLAARRSPSRFAVLSLVAVLGFGFPIMTSLAATAARREAEQSARMSDWLESTILGFVGNEHRDGVEGAASVWARMSARISGDEFGENDSASLVGDDVFRANVLRVRAGALARTGEYAAAIDAYLEASAIMDRELGFDHPASLGCRMRMIEAAAASGDRERIEANANLLLRGRSAVDFSVSEESMSLFSPTAGGLDGNPEVDALIEFELQSRAPVATAKLIQSDYSRRFAEISSLTALGESRLAADGIGEWMNEVLGAGDFDLAFRLALRFFHLDRTLDQVLSRYEEWCDSGLLASDSERVLQLALAMHIDRYYDEYDGLVEVTPCVLEAGQPMTTDAISRRLVLDWWGSVDPAPETMAYLRGFTALVIVTDFLVPSEIYADAMDADLACWRLVGSKITRLDPGIMAERIVTTQAESRKSVDYGEFGRGWSQWANYAVVQTGPWDSRSDYLRWRSDLDGTEVQRFGFEEHEDLGFRTEVWFGRLCVELCELGLCDDDEVVSANFNLATALLAGDEAPSKDALHYMGRAFEEVILRFGIDAEYALLIGLEYLDRLSRAGDTETSLEVRTILMAEYPMLGRLLMQREGHGETQGPPTR